MERTLILYHNDIKDTMLLDLFEKILGPADKNEWDKIQGDLKPFSNIALIIPLNFEHMALCLRLFLENNKHEFANKRVAVIYINQYNNPRLTYNQIYDEITACLNECYVTAEYFELDNINQEEMTQKIIEIKRYLTDNSDMPRERLVEEITHVFNSHNTCTLCTGAGHFLRATPIEYIYNEKNGSLYFLSEGGEKFANLASNPQVAVAIYKEFCGFDKLEGLQVEGIIEMIDLFSVEYNENIIRRGLTPESLEKLPSRLNMFKIIPQRIYLLNANLKKDGYQARQVLDLMNN